MALAPTAKKPNPNQDPLLKYLDVGNPPDTNFDDGLPEQPAQTTPQQQSAAPAAPKAPAAPAAASPLPPVPQTPGMTPANAVAPGEPVNPDQAPGPAPTPMPAQPPAPPPGNPMAPVINAWPQAPAAPPQAPASWDAIQTNLRGQQVGSSITGLNPAGDTATMGQPVGPYSPDTSGADPLLNYLDGGDPNDDPTGTGGGPAGPVVNPDPPPAAPTDPTSGSDGSPYIDPHDPQTIPNSPIPRETYDPSIPGLGPTNWATQDYSNPENIKGFFRSKGLTDPSQLDRLAATWGAYWQQWGSRDPAEFYRRMQDENDLTGSNARGGGTNTHADATDPRVMEAIMKLLSEGSQPVTGDDPAIRMQFNPQSQIIQRNNVRSKASAAERNFANGQTGESSNDLAGAQIDQASGNQEADLMGTLVSTELQARRSMVVNALQLAHGEEQLKLQQQLAEIDANLRLLGINNQNQQFYDDLGFRIGRSASDQNNA